MKFKKKRKRLGLMRLRIKGAICLGLWHRTPFVTSPSKFEIGTDSVNLLYVKQMTKQPWITSSITLIKHSRFRFVLLTTLVALFFLIHVTREVEFLENHNRFYNPHEKFFKQNWLWLFMMGVFLVFFFFCNRVNLWISLRSRTVLKVLLGNRT